MEPPSPCPSVEELRALLSGDLPEADQAAMAAHLDACPRCRQRLETSAGGTRWLPDAKNWNPDDAPPPGAALEQTMSRLLSLDGQARSISPDAIEAEALDFLTPAVHAGLIGHFGPYDVVERIGQGGMGVVLKAHDLVLNRTVALKVMAPQLAASGSARKRFLREARSAAAVNHDHLVTIYAVDEANHLPYLAMEYVEGPTLQHRIEAAGPLEIREITRIGMQIASGLAAAHAQGLIHRDIKPANILLAGEAQRVKITDFGLAKVASDTSITQTAALAGTPQYMAPEQARGEGIDHRADLFSLGSVLYAMCTGRAPFGGGTTMAVLRELCEEAPPPIREANPDIPDWLADIVERLLAKDPNDRFQSAAEVADLLGEHLTRVDETAVGSAVGPAASARTVARPGAQPAGGRSARWWLAAGAAVGLLVVLVALSELTGITKLRRFFATRSRDTTPAEPAAEPPLPEQGFVLVARSGQRRVLGELHLAVAAARGGETIEIRWNGPLASRPIRLDKPLRIEAAQGYAPVVEVRSLQAPPCFDTTAALVLEGVSFRFPVAGRPPDRPVGPRRIRRPPRGVVTVRGAPLYMANCLFAALGPGDPAANACVAVFDSPAGEIRNCLFLGRGGAAVRWTCTDGNRLAVRNSASAGLRPVSIRATGQRAAHLHLTRNTFCGAEAVFLAVPGDPTGRILDVRASRNLFEVGTVLTHHERLRGKLVTAVRWAGERNLFAVKDGFVGTFAAGGPPPRGRPRESVASIKSLAEWNDLWKQTDSGSRQIPRAFGPELARKLKTGPHHLTAEDLRRKDADAGADVDLLGPGRPYDRWRKTPDYQAWRRTTKPPPARRP